MSIKEKLNKAKEAIYKTFSKVESTLEQTVEDNRGTLEKVANAVDKTVETVKDSAKKTYNFLDRADKKLEDTVRDTRKKTHNFLDRADKWLEKTTIAAQDAYDDVSARVSEKYNDLRNQFYTDGDYDSKKTEEFFKDKGKAILKFGKKAGEELYELGKNGLLKTKEDYRKVIPSREELETTYKGIGGKAGRWLIRSDYEGCLEYHAEVSEKLHPRTNYRDEILKDIKESASKSTYDLKKYYLSLDDPFSVFGKLETIKKYVELA